jgi:hypothetical protein
MIEEENPEVETMELGFETQGQGVEEEEKEDTLLEETEEERIQLMWTQMRRMMKEARANRKKIDELEQENRMMDIELSKLQEEVNQPTPVPPRKFVTPFPPRTSVTPSTTPAPSLPKIKINPPQPFDGSDPSQYLRFLCSC